MLETHCRAAEILANYFVYEGAMQRRKSNKIPVPVFYYILIAWLNILQFLPHNNNEKKLTKNAFKPVMHNIWSA